MDEILLSSTNGRAEKATFREALLKGIAPDRGLYMPERIPVIPPDEIASYAKMDYHKIAFQVSRYFLGGQISDKALRAITKDAYDFAVPLEHVYEKKYVMRLDQGPTASFKDFAARMMGRLMQHYLNKEKRNLLILTATSGDTGSAIANAFYGLDNIKVVVLFPEAEVTARQRKQMTTLGKNVQIIGLDAKFDDCQALVKTAFADRELDYLNLSSANSINIGRLVPQTVYYFYAFSRLCGSADREIIFSVPSGNFGDMMGGVIAMRMGLPVKKFIIATNENDEYPIFLKTGQYTPIVPSVNCISSAMNVGHPSNISRLVSVYNGSMDETGAIGIMPDLKQMRRDMYAISISDRWTGETIQEAWSSHKLLLEPHGAVGWAGLQQYLTDYPEHDTHDQVCVSLETAHPAKFPEKIRELLGLDPELPPSLEGIEEKEEQYDTIGKEYGEFKAYLLGRYGS
ncbi:threonine synthase [bacterium]|nr:threonine synthase [bacterium]